MIGASVIVDTYVACEPSERTFKGLLSLSEFLSAFRPEFGTEIVNTPYEDSDEKECFYDFALTSPPYFDTERYADEPTQSWKRYGSFAHPMQGRETTERGTIESFSVGPAV